MIETLNNLLGLLAGLFVGLLGLLVIWQIITGKIDLKYLIADDPGDASMSRFQLLIFTFVVAIGLLKIVEASGKFPDIPNSILLLVGVSASTYGVGKALTPDAGGNPKTGQQHSGTQRASGQAAAEE